MVGERVIKGSVGRSSFSVHIGENMAPGNSAQHYDTYVFGSPKVTSQIHEATGNPLFSEGVHESVTIHEIASVESLGAEVSSGSPLLFVDFTTGDQLESGLSAVRQARSSSPDTEITAIVSPPTAGLMLEMHRAGVTSYVDTPISPTKLAIATARAISLWELAGSHQLNDMIHPREFFDNLLKDHLAAVASVQRGRSHPLLPFSIILMDVDQTGDLGGNDSDVMNKVSQEIARIAVEKNRTTDVITRHRNSELVILLRGMNYSMALMRAEMLRKSVEGLTADSVGTSQPPQVSVGVVTYPSAAVDDPTRILDQCKEAVITAQALGGNIACGFDADGNPLPFAELGG